jgi:hypothetical protein
MEEERRIFTIFGEDESAWMESLERGLERIRGAEIPAGGCRQRSQGRARWGRAQPGAAGRRDGVWMLSGHGAVLQSPAVGRTQVAGRQWGGHRSGSD